MPQLPGSPPIDVVLRRSVRARRFSLRVSSLDGAVTLSMPQRARESEAMEFLRAQEGWLRQALVRVAPVRQVQAGQVFPYEGQALILTPLAGRGLPRVEGERLIIPTAEPQLAARLKAHLKARARDRLAEACDRHAASLGRRVAMIALRDTRSRWGSCTAAGRLMFSWRLAMAPPEVLDYVAAHEVAHLAEMNHSPDFWAIVDRLHPGWQKQRAWLRAQGAALHSWRF